MTIAIELSMSLCLLLSIWLVAIPLYRRRGLLIAPAYEA
jgi:hypothetical protein